ncbi:hypothetical protein CLF_113093 [Clonorchis sinensis]|uniref:Uncharacterized protein n=1 Tax=Clonorchis sinensis TaxID=79923 RepID=G7YMS9_CLOSI|nr:hypothetical protein CLF_113093 [Clonorchis sinensis]
MAASKALLGPTQSLLSNYVDSQPDDNYLCFCIGFIPPVFFLLARPGPGNTETNIPCAFTSGCTLPIELSRNTIESMVRGGTRERLPPEDKQFNLKLMANQTAAVDACAPKCMLVQPNIIPVSNLYSTAEASKTANDSDARYRRQEGCPNRTLGGSILQVTRRHWVHQNRKLRVSLKPGEYLVNLVITLVTQRFRFHFRMQRKQCRSACSYTASFQRTFHYSNEGVSMLLNVACEVGADDDD